MLSLLSILFILFVSGSEECFKKRRATRHKV